MNAAPASALVNKSVVIKTLQLLDKIVILSEAKDLLSLAPAKKCDCLTLELFLKLRESALQLPLHASTLVGPNKFPTFFRNAIPRRILRRANCSTPECAVAPKTLSGNKTMFQ